MQTQEYRLKRHVDGSRSSVHQRGHLNHPKIQLRPPYISTICVQQSHASARQRFTIAHEMGHWCLKHQNISGPHVHVNRGHLVSARGSLAAEGTDPHEIEANQFAAELLMPRHLVKEAVERLGRRLTEDDVTTLAKEFEVSERAMDIRLRTLRLI